ncbi:MAG: aminotransferase class I/II-fold pyridoxal phosphate-dependent enzyme, partial [Bacteroidetes bacterium]|nr:aminotransferase class I/II-fold pyridoxal phosphate-dependent enzyme [Bacteroidota bacterium]
MKSKFPNCGPSIFTTMSKMAQDYGAINLSQGFPNFPIDPLLQEIVQKKTLENVHQYVPMAGLPALLDKIGELIFNQYQRQIDATTELLITAGATQAIFTVVQAIVQKGEEV